LESVLKVSLDAETLGQPLDWPAVADLLQPVTELLHQPVPESQVAPVQADPVHLAIKDSALTVDRQHRVIAAYERQLRRQARNPFSQAGTSCH
jgi:hypothetical protein